jgi:hypothetical protein
MKYEKMDRPDRKVEQFPQNVTLPEDIPYRHQELCDTPHQI